VTRTYPLVSSAGTGTQILLIVFPTIPSSSFLCALCGIILLLFKNEEILPQRNAEAKKRQDKRKESVCKIFPHRR
jgi:hypothetical protein